eukprot:1353421-Heterocapsa_arctica.AAC.1
MANAPLEFPLHQAATWRQAAVVGLLLAARGNPNLKEEMGRSPVYKAAEKNATECLELSIYRLLRWPARI